MKFSVKTFIMFFIATIGGGFAGSYVNGMLGLKAGADIFTYIVFMLVPVLLTYLVYENYLRQKSI